MAIPKQPPSQERDQATDQSTAASVDRDTRRTRRQRLFLFLRISIAVLLMVLILNFVDLTVTVESIRKSDWRYAVAIFALLFLDRYLMAYKWALLLRVRGVAISNWTAFRIYLLSGFVGTFLPTGVGADAVKLARTTLTTGKLDEVAASVVMERAVGLLAVTVLALGGLTFLVSSGKSQFASLLYVTWLFVGGILGVLFISLHGGMLNWLHARLSSLKRYKLVRILLNSHLAYVQLGSHKAVLLWFFLLSLLEHGLVSFLCYCAGLALGLSVSFVYFLALVPVTMVAAHLPISVGGIGVFESIFVALFSLAGLSGEEAFAIALYLRAIGLVALVPGAMIFGVEAVSLRRANFAGIQERIDVQRAQTQATWEASKNRD